MSPFWCPDNKKLRKYYHSIYFRYIVLKVSSWDSAPSDNFIDNLTRLFGFEESARNSVRNRWEIDLESTCFQAIQLRPYWWRVLATKYVRQKFETLVKDLIIFKHYCEQFKNLNQIKIISPAPWLHVGDGMWVTTCGWHVGDGYWRGMLERHVGNFWILITDLK